ncbi:hypothetical protein IWW36_002687 [Coemansia brasiliensis]|uniref:Uncharacterized protein n=1 Tax=Coemansia brasiliensis TaxID=2650707 RepID=A0A9W8I963_9FUNG|nr:hypothetical protein IWW36_002687 [Coemansia brasiliensis]
MSAKLLENSFYGALADFPLLAGYLHEVRTGWLQVVVDKFNLNMPEFKETQSAIHFDTLESARFSPKALPSYMATTTAFAVGNSVAAVKLAKVHVMRLKGNSGVVIFASLAHGVVDAVGYSAFINRWAEISKHFAQGGNDQNVPLKTVNSHRYLIYRDLSPMLQTSDNLLKDVYLPSTLFSRIIAWIAPEKRARLLGSINSFVGTTNCCYYISKQSLDQLHSAVEQISKSAEQISYNDVLTALCGIVMAQSINQSQQSSRFWSQIARLFTQAKPDSPSARFDISMAVDIRPRIGKLASLNYVGNCMIKQVIPCKFNDLISQDESTIMDILAQLSTKVRAKTNASSPEYISQFIRTVDAEPDCFVRPLVCGTRYPMKLLTTNHTRVNYYSADFGWEIPEWVNPIEGSFPNFIGILPTYPSLDGYHIHVMASKQVHQGFKSSQIWSKYFECVH